MPDKVDNDLRLIRAMFDKGFIYRLDGIERPLWLWHRDENVKFGRKVTTRDLFIYLKIERCKTIDGSFRLYMIRGEDIGYVLIKRYELISGMKWVSGPNKP